MGKVLIIGGCVRKKTSLRIDIEVEYFERQHVKNINMPNSLHPFLQRPAGGMCPPQVLVIAT
jgi:hypothetical protein